MDVTTIAHQKLNRIITEGPGAAESTLQLVQENQPTDFVVPSRDITVIPDGVIVNMLMQNGNSPKEYKIHQHALGQMADRTGIPRKFVSRLLKQDERGAELLAHNLNETFSWQVGTRNLLRVVQDDIRACLSDKYLRVDAGLLVESFVKATQAVGAVPIDARYTDTKFFIRMALPTIFEPVSGDPVIVGMNLKESSFGDGAHSLSVSLTRLLCLNGMVGDDVLRRVHLGSRLGETIAISQKTYRLDSEALASGIGDAVQQFFTKEVIEEKLNYIKGAHEQKVNLKTYLERMRKDNKISKGELNGIAEAFTMGGVEQLPPGNTAWRLANAISLFSKNEDVDLGRGMELEYLAGAVAGLNKTLKSVDD